MSSPIKISILTLHRGEILALLGENGAGKSTLMNIIYGLYQPTEGEIRFDGRAVEMHSPKDAIDLGIGMVHQHFQLVPVMSVVDNIMLGSESVNGGLLNRQGVRRPDPGTCRPLQHAGGPQRGH